MAAKSIPDKSKSDAIPEVAHHLRNAHQQNKYREQSKSQNKENQHVAHYISLELAEFIDGVCHEPLTIGVLKDLVNDFSNFRLVNQLTNLKAHKTIDSQIKNHWIAVILSLNEQQKYLLHLNPSRWYETIINDSTMKDKYLLALPGNSAKRIQAQCERFDSKYPHHYRALCRALYRLFRDNNKRILWDDRLHDRSFSEYIKENLKSKQIIYKTEVCQKTRCKFPDTFKLSVKTELVIKFTTYDDEEDNKESPSKGFTTTKTNENIKKSIKHTDEIKQKNQKDTIANKDESKGGLYYLMSSGHKEHVKEKEKEKEVSGQTGERILYQGPKGGFYYITASGRKQYVKQ